MTDAPAPAAPDPDPDSEAATARLYHAATRDPLTGLPNRHYFREAAERALLSSGRHLSAVTVLAVQVDGFEALAARHGAAAGDAVLMRLGVLLEDRFRRSDLIGRLDQARFAVMLPGADRAAAHLLAGNLRDAVAADDGTGDGSSRRPLPPITVCIGIAVAAPDNQAALEPLLELAQEALDRARAEGPGRIAEL